MLRRVQSESQRFVFRKNSVSSTRSRGTLRYYCTTNPFLSSAPATVAANVQRSENSYTYVANVDINGNSGTSSSHGASAVKGAPLAVDYSLISKDLVSTMKRIITEKTIERVQNPGLVGRSMNYPELLQRQLFVEEERLSEAVSSYQETFRNLINMGRGTSMKSIQRTLLQWYEPLLNLITNEIADIEKCVSGEDRQSYGAYLLMLPPEKLAVITLDTALNGALRTGNVGEKLSRLAIAIADIIEAEVHIMRMKADSQSLPWWKRVQLENEGGKGKKVSSTRTINRNIRKIANEMEWSTSMKVKIGVKLLDLLLQAANHKEPGAESSEPKNSFIYSNNFHKMHRRQGRIKLDPKLYTRIVNRNFARMHPRFYPMLVPANRWNNRKFYGAFYRLQAPLMKSIIASQTLAVKRAEMGKVLEVLDYLGQVGWKVNTNILDVVNAAVEQKLQIGEIPSFENLPAPTKESCYRPLAEHSKSSQQKIAWQRKRAAAAATSASQIAALDALDDDDDEEEDDDDEDAIEAAEGNAEDDNPLFDSIMYQDMVRKVNKRNAELHSLRCDMKIKLDIAELFREDVIFFPHNLDFRGRAYPVPQNLNHMGPDMCRALLMFDSAKPLGESGLMWLKIHLANLCGYNKVSMAERVAWVDELLEKVRDSAERPLEGQRWWAEQENPFQALACCMEIIAAIDSPNPAEYMCSLPVHQDGSCNGLQHYAALGRDSEGGKAVNLLDADRPQDVYSKVLEGVVAKLEEDCKISEDSSNEKLVKRGKLARLVNDVVDRQVIKQVQTYPFPLIHIHFHLYIVNIRRYIILLLFFCSITDCDDISLRCDENGRAGSSPSTAAREAAHQSNRDH